MSITPRDLVIGEVGIASLPEVFMKVSEMISSPHHSAADIGRVLSNDTALSARLLKIVNSVFYGYLSRIETVSRAIAVVGTRELQELVLATSVIRVFKGIPSNLVTMEWFWRHSICCAITSRMLAEMRGEQLVERFFVAGLLHDIGSLILYRKLPELAREAIQLSYCENVPLECAETEVIGFDHSTVGAELLRKWKLPERLQETTEFHHRPSTAQRYPNDAALIHIADAVSDAMNFSNHNGSQKRQVDSQVWKLAGIPGESIPSIVPEVEQQLKGPLFYVAKSGGGANSNHSIVGWRKKGRRK
jgi:putative nucleotidyltransferase with HDIG domain